MSLVVAAIHDGDQVTMVSDTKVSFFYPDGHPDAARTRRTYFDALPKIVILRPELMVGVTGDSPHEAIADLRTHRNDSVDHLLAHLATMTSAGFVVAALHPARLWSVSGGRIDERTAVRRAWSGDLSAYDVFRMSWDKWPAETEVPFLLSSSMQFLTSFDPVASVGGFTLTADTRTDGFRFQAWVTAVSVSHQVHVLPGDDPTRGTLGLLIPQTGVGLVFRQDRPWVAERVGAAAPESLIAAIAETFGDAFIESSPSPGFPFAAM
jgi:hypothetical protein